VIIPTLDRLDALQTTVASVRRHAGGLAHEVIVIDGGSRDGTGQWLLWQADLVGILHGRRLGCVRAFNDGFRLSRGRYCAQLSDDVEIVDDCLGEACRRLDADPCLGQVVIPHIEPGWSEPTVPRFRTRHGKYPFAAFGVTRRDLGDRVGWWGDYYHQQGDPELAIKVVNAGYRVEALAGRALIHRPGPSELRKYGPDAELLNARWWDWRPQE
jgi:glycosyltransferase involved in cell wall biosynthesis